ncbi:hypothetical protein ASPBRDRAFT_45449 [Aspergillus brasiliensis CBS 101740]|uniref:Cytochrome P450 n=1 Tax=Aspergillus brasiliensis (strain CBS 101740 / IMI 381727 / IBT 21946) TaxID=767769 RepID=A0A1L9UEQ7_ASPBC|nr:hypothetical protein ASPBRDRAFT_45449 [Aspergillus brasiliensis CBS 101740]
MALLSGLTWAEIAIYLTTSLVVYFTMLVMYRLWLSPLSRFPGSPLAKTTYLYEFYYDWVKPGQYYRKIHEMHQCYGPIIQVSPDELHISDPSYHKQLFVMGGARKTDLYPASYRGTPYEDFTEIIKTHNVHRLVRAPIDKYFSRASMMAAEPQVVNCIKRFTSRLGEFKDTGKPVNLSYALLSLVVDLVSATVCEEPTQYLSHPEFNAAWFKAKFQGIVTVPLLAMVPKLARSPLMRILRFLQKQASTKMGHRESQYHQSFENVLRPNQTANFDKSDRAEATKRQFGNDIYDMGGQLIQEGGIYPITNCLQTIIVNLALDDKKRQTLQNEISNFLAQDQAPEVTWKELEKLPYLYACVKESLRLVTGIMKRITRVFPENEFVVEGWTVPKGTPVGMSSYWMHMDPEVFPEPEKFKPERWLHTEESHDPRTTEYMVPFGRGSRDCLGKHLAWMALCHIVFELYRPGALKLELYDTDESTVTMVRGYVFALPEKVTGGVKALVQSPS